jgi:RecB family exonuclease
MDLFYSGPDGTPVVVDYKTGSADRPAYEDQLVVYARAVTGLGEANPVAYLVRLGAGGDVEEREVDVGPVPRAAADGLFLAFRDALAGGGPQKRGPDSVCATCGYRDWCPESVSGRTSCGGG